MDTDWLPTLGIAALFMFVVYRRARRLFTRQRVGSRRLIVRLVILGSVCALILPILAATRGVESLAGLVVGVALGLLAFRFTRFDVTEEGVFFTPNAYIGAGVLSLFLGRMAYRMFTVYWLTSGGLPGSGSGEVSPLSAGFQRSPVTAMILAILLGYYVTYYATVLVRGHQLRRIA